MLTVLLAVDNHALLSVCKSCLRHTGYDVLVADRPLQALSLADVVHWDAAVLDASPLGRGSLDALTIRPGSPLLGLGLEDERLRVSIPLPLVSTTLVSTLEALLFAGETSPGAELQLNPLRRLASVGPREVYLTRTEFRLLQLLYERRPSDVTLPEVLLTVWGSTEGQGTSELVRAHLRNLRRKLQQIGLTDVVRSRRGRGYALEL